MPRRNLAWVLGIAAVVTLGLAATHIFSWAQERQQRRDQNYELVGLFVDVLHEVAPPLRSMNRVSSKGCPSGKSFTRSRR